GAPRALALPREARDPPRPEAAEHDPRAEWCREGPRLRHLAHDDPQRSHADGDVARLARVHGAGALRRQCVRPPDRPLRPRRRALRAADGSAAVPGRLASRALPRAPDSDRAIAATAAAGDPGMARAPDRAAPREARLRALPERRGGADGPRRASRHRAAA